MESTISKLFDSKNRKFEIPSYQRAYSWEEKQIVQFLEDLRNSESHYYLGHFLFETKDNEENTLLIIDGQQRLTTCIIFFSVVRMLLSKRKNNGENIELNLDDIKDYFLRDIQKDTQKFRTVRDDNNFFIDEIIDSREHHSQELNTSSKIRIRNAKEIFQKQLSSEKTSDIQKWCDLIQNATITEYVVKDKTQATQVFAFQNDRGKKLSNLEIIKAYFMLQIYLSGNSREGIEESIIYLEVDLSEIYKQIVRIKIDEDEVLNYFWRTVSGKGFYSEEVVKGIKELLSSLTADKSVWIREFVSGLTKAFQTVERIERSQNSFTRDLLYLNNMALAYPFIIKAHMLNAPEPCISRLIRLFENITFRYLLRGGRAEIESRLNSHLININMPEDLDKNISEIVDNIKHNAWWGYWNDQAMTSYLSGYFYQNRVDNYVLWKYELFLCDEHHPTPHKVTFGDLINKENVEHIAPQTPTDDNPTSNGYGVYKDEQNSIEGIASGGWLNSIGNLMLISQHHNCSIGNRPFGEKLSSYGKENLLNQQKEIREFVTDQDAPAWDKAAIVKRQEKILKAAADLWNLDSI